MSTLALKNTTGRRAGSFVCYEWGEDLFGWMYLEVCSGRDHLAGRRKRMVFSDVRQFLIELDKELERRESRDYLPV